MAHADQLALLRAHSGHAHLEVEHLQGGPSKESVIALRLSVALAACRSRRAVKAHTCCDCSALQTCGAHLLRPRRRGSLPRGGASQKRGPGSPAGTESESLNPCNLISLIGCTTLHKVHRGLPLPRESTVSSAPSCVLCPQRPAGISPRSDLEGACNGQPARGCTVAVQTACFDA